MSASLIGVDYGLRAWKLGLQYNATLLSLQSYAIDTLWGDANVENQAGKLTVLMNTPANDDESNPSVRGSGVPILDATFLVASTAASGSHASAVTLLVESMINFMTNMFVENEPGLVVDGRDGSQDAGTVDVEAPVVQGIFAHFDGGSAVLQNTAPLTNTPVRKQIRTYAVSTRPSTGASQVSASCCITRPTPETHRCLSLLLTQGHDAKAAPQSDSLGPRQIDGAHHAHLQPPLWRFGGRGDWQCRRCCS